MEMTTMRMVTWMAMGLLALTTMACGSDVDGGSGGGGSGGSGAAGGQGGSGGSGGAGGQGGSGGSGGVGGQGGSGGASGTVCGGLRGATCPTGAYCDYQPSTCGFDDGTGICTPIPSGTCPDSYIPVCGCDGTVYSNDCEATAAGVDVDLTGSCTPPQDTLFPCGAHFCSLATEYCQRQVSDIGGEDDAFSCMPLPVACGDSPDCACLSGEPCSNLCDGDAANGLTLTCPGG